MTVWLFLFLLLLLQVQENLNAKKKGEETFIEIKYQDEIMNVRNDEEEEVIDRLDYFARRWRSQ